MHLGVEMEVGERMSGVMWMALHRFHLLLLSVGWVQVGWRMLRMRVASRRSEAGRSVHFS